MYDFIIKEKVIKEFQNNIKNIDFPYGKEGRLMFAELDSKAFIPTRNKTVSSFAYFFYLLI